MKKSIVLSIIVILIVSVMGIAEEKKPLSDIEIERNVVLRENYGDWEVADFKIRLSYIDERHAMREKYKDDEGKLDYHTTRLVIAFRMDRKLIAMKYEAVENVIKKTYAEKIKKLNIVQNLDEARENVMKAELLWAEQLWAAKKLGIIEHSIAMAHAYKDNSYGKKTAISVFRLKAEKILKQYPSLRFLVLDPEK